MKLNFVKTSMISGLASLIKLMSLFLLNKIISNLLGPSGFAMIGQLQNFTQLYITFSNLGSNTGVTKLTSQYEDNKRLEIWSTILKVTLPLSISMSLILIIFSYEFALLIFNNDDYYFVFLVLSAVLPFVTLNLFLLSVLNGIREIKKYLLCNVFVSIASLILVSILITIYGINGALIGLVLQHFIGLVAAIILTKKHIDLFNVIFKLNFNVEIFKRILKISSLALTSGLVASFSMINVRNSLIENLTLDDAGYWDALWRFSSVYLLFITFKLDF